MRFIAIVIALSVCRIALTEEIYWNQFRGPRTDGTTDVKGLPVTFGDDSPEIVWKTPIPGRAWSSPVVWGKQIWVTNAPEVPPFSKPEKPKLDKPIDLSA